MGHVPSVKNVEGGFVDRFQKSKELNEQGLPHANLHLMHDVDSYQAVYIEAMGGQSLGKGILKGKRRAVSEALCTLQRMVWGPVRASARALSKNSRLQVLAMLVSAISPPGLC